MEGKWQKRAEMESSCYSIYSHAQNRTQSLLGFHRQAQLFFRTVNYSLLSIQLTVFAWITSVPSNHGRRVRDFTIVRYTPARLT